MFLLVNFHTSGSQKYGRMTANPNWHEVLTYRNEWSYSEEQLMISGPDNHEVRMYFFL